MAEAVAWSRPDGSRLADLETYLAALITVRTRPLGTAFRMPQLGPLE